MNQQHQNHRLRTNSIRSLWEFFHRQRFIASKSDEQPTCINSKKASECGQEIPQSHIEYRPATS